MKLDTPPAFPLAINKNCEEHVNGMTLRDYFAGQTLLGKAGYRTLQTVEEQELCASQCYSMADAMLAERLKE